MPAATAPLVTKTTSTPLRLKVAISPTIPEKSEEGTVVDPSLTTKRRRLPQEAREASADIISRVVAHDPRAEGSKLLVHALISTVDLANVVDLARSLGGQARDEQRHAGSNVRALQSRAIEL